MKKGFYFTIIGALMVVSMFATDITFNIYKTNQKVQRTAVSNIDSIKVDAKDSLLFIHKKDGTISTVPVAEIDSMNYTSGEYTLPTVETVSANYNFTNARTLCVANVTNDGGCDISERGICWSTTSVPTVKHNKFAYTGGTNGKFYAPIDGLSVTGTYYVRAYAANCKGISYGQTIKVQPTTGNVTYTLDIDKTVYPEYYTLIKAALDSACYYYNRYTTFKGNIYVYYNAGIPTAQASYRGSIGFGPSTSYMWVGTTMHEMAHYFGSGTTTAWKNLMVGGVWQGAKGQALCQELLSTTLKGDNNSNPIHYWPTGINYRSEVSSANDLINHAKIVQAMLIEDCGLPSGW